MSCYDKHKGRYGRHRLRYCQVLLQHEPDSLGQVKVRYDRYSSRYDSPATIPSEYLECSRKDNGDNLRSSSSVSSGLGAHWKKINSIIVPPRPMSAHAPSSFDFSTGTSSFNDTLHSITPTDAKSSFSSEGTIQKGSSSFSTSSSSSSSAATSSSSVASSVASSTASSTASASSTVKTNPEPMTLLTESTDKREERQCLSLQNQGLRELSTVLDQNFDEIIDTIIQVKVAYGIDKNASEQFWKKYDLYANALEEKADEVQAYLDAKSNKLLDIGSMLVNEFRKKTRIEEFVRAREAFFEQNVSTMSMMESNQRRIERIQKLIMNYQVDHGPLTTFEQEDVRTDDVFYAICKMIGELPLNASELKDLKEFIQKTDQHPNYSRIYKCDLVWRRLIATMSVWNEQKTATLKSEGFKSVCNLNAFVSSSFALSDLSNNDANLNDLASALRTSQVKTAVEGPNNVIEMGPWSSLATAYSSGEVTANSKSLGEPRTLSSYEYHSSADQGQSTLSSLSTHSMPSQVVEHLPKSSTSDESAIALKTALSRDVPVVFGPSRCGPNTERFEQSTIGAITTNSQASIDFSSASLEDIVEEALHTAKEKSTTDATTLLEALKSSASKCGVAISDLLTAVSSSSESLSNTQSSHSCAH
uniref:Uncharacterized protein n=2 Tax=Caenorhabditis japonica TaxID=281687 RepID=A0A8R1I637_CAEJA